MAGAAARVPAPKAPALSPPALATQEMAASESQTALATALRTAALPAASVPRGRRAGDVYAAGVAHTAGERGDVLSERGQGRAQLGYVFVAAPAFGEQLGVVDGHGGLPGDSFRQA